MTVILYDSATEGNQYWSESFQVKTPVEDKRFLIDVRTTANSIKIGLYENLFNGTFSSISEMKELFSINLLVEKIDVSRNQLVVDFVEFIKEVNKPGKPEDLDAIMRKITEYSLYKLYLPKEMVNKT